MENQEPLETVISAFAVIVNEIQDPLGVFLFHINDERDKNGKIAQPAGWKLPGGSYEKPRDKTPRHTARNETLLEIGFETKIAKFFRGSQYGEALLENKTFISENESFRLKVYTFFMKRIGNKRKKNATPNEGGARESFSLTNILMMPLARNTETGEYNPYGIHFSARKRIFITLKRAGYNFLELIPNLPELIDKIGWEEVGEDVYWILREALDPAIQLKSGVDAPEPESATSLEDMEPALDYSESVHKKICSCNACWQRWWANGLVSAQI